MAICTTEIQRVNKESNEKECYVIENGTVEFFNECRKQHGTPIMESQTFNQFVEEICK